MWQCSPYRCHKYCHRGEVPVRFLPYGGDVELGAQIGHHVTETKELGAEQEKRDRKTNNKQKGKNKEVKITEASLLAELLP